MATIFDDLESALSPYVGGNAVAGAILGGVLCIVLIIGLEWLIGSKAKGAATFMISAGLGIVLSTAFGWFDLWVVLFVGLIVILLIMQPWLTGSRDESG